MINEPIENKYKELNQDEPVPNWIKQLGERSDKIIINALNEAQKESNINHPAHYNLGMAKCSECSHPIECIEVAHTFPFLLGNVIKYIWRHEHKDGIEALKKGQWYLNDYIRRLEEKE